MVRFQRHNRTHIMDKMVSKKLILFRGVVQRSEVTLDQLVAFVLILNVDSGR